MNLTIESMQDSIQGGMDSAQREISIQIEKRKRLSTLSPQLLLDFISDSIADVGHDVGMLYAYQYKSSTEIFGTIKGMTYDELVQRDDATLSYNGKYINSSIVYSDDDNGLTFRINAEARIPCEDKEILVACGKIQEQVETNQVAMC